MNLSWWTYLFVDFPEYAAIEIDIAVTHLWMR
jgi:hypothetical protein